MGVKDLTKPYVYSEILVRQASGEDPGRYAAQAFALFAKRRKISA
jgi:hypothetical protein